MALRRRLETLVLAYLNATGKRGAADVRKMVQRYHPEDLSAAEARGLVDEVVAALVAAGLIETRPLRLTEAGRARLGADLGTRPAPSWRQAEAKILPALALGLDPSSPEGRHAVDATDSVRAAVLAREAGLPFGKRTTLTQTVNALAQRAIGTSRLVRSARDIKPRLAGAWLRGDGIDGAPGANGAEEPKTRDRGEGAHALGEPPAAALGIEAFAQVVREAAARADSGRFGDRKVFVSALWRALSADDPRFASRTIEEFKARLVEANARRHLTLARADYVAARDPVEVARSHIENLNSDFHFVVDDSENTEAGR